MCPVLVFAHHVGRLPLRPFDRHRPDRSPQARHSSPQVGGYVFRAAATADGIKGVLRRIRPQEAAALDAIDQDIAKNRAR